MKRFLITLITVYIMLFAFDIANASAATEGIYTYTVSNGEVTITDCNASASGDIVIPAALEGNPVTAIGKKAFEWCTGIRSVTIPDSIISIGESAFDGCSNLESVTIGNGVTTMGANAFGFCSKLNKVNITDPAAWYNIDFHTESSNPLFYGNNLYFNGILVTNLTIPDGVTSIGDYAFICCDSITIVTIPDTVTTIGNHAFKYCYGLTSVAISDSVTSIGEYAFSNCKELTSLTMGYSVKSIGSEAFYNCSKLKDVYYNDTADEWNKISIGSFNEPLTNATMHCVQVEYRINQITIKDMKGNSLPTIPEGNFLATVSFTNVSSSEDTVIVLAQYEDTGEFKGLMYIQTEDVPTGSTIKLSIPVDNSSGNVAKLKAFCWDSFSALTPMGKPVSFPAEQEDKR